MSYQIPQAWGTAKIISKGGLCVDSRGAKSVEDVYGIVLAPGTRPVAGDTYSIPKRGATHPDASAGNDYEGLVVKSVKFSQPDPHSLVWEARVTYGKRDSSDNSDDEGEEPTPDPTKTSPGWKRIRLGYANIQREFVEDTQTPPVPVLNSAGDPFENAPTIDTPLTQLTLVGKTRRNPLSHCIAVNNTINSETKTVCGVTIEARHGLLSIDAEYDSDAADPIWTITATITINPAGWDMKVLQNGFRYKDENGNLVKFTEKTEDGREVECTTPMPLDAEGHDGRGKEAAWATFKPYFDNSWETLDLPSGDISSSGSNSSNSSNSGNSGSGQE